MPPPVDAPPSGGAFNFFATGKTLHKGLGFGAFKMNRNLLSGLVEAAQEGINDFIAKKGPTLYDGIDTIQNKGLSDWEEFSLEVDVKELEAAGLIEVYDYWDGSFSFFVTEAGMKHLGQ